jgi:hypothetical protein
MVFFLFKKYIITTASLPRSQRAKSYDLDQFSNELDRERAKVALSLAVLREARAKVDICMTLQTIL